MKILCKSPTQVSGFGVVKKGQTINLDPSKIDDHIVANFVRAEDGKPIVVGSGDGNHDAGGESSTGNGGHQPTAEELHQQEIEQLIKRTAQISKEKLVEMLNAEGVPFKPNAKATELAKILLRHRGEDVD